MKPRRITAYLMNSIGIIIEKIIEKATSFFAKEIYLVKKVSLIKQTYLIVLEKFF